MNDVEFVDKLSTALNRNIDILGDWVSEDTEQDIFESLVRTVAPYVPQAIRPVLIDAADGLDDDEIQRHTDTITREVSDNILERMPFFLRMSAGGAITASIRQAVEFLLSFAKKGVAFELPSETPEA